MRSEDTRVVGTCAYCRGKVTLRAGERPFRREASCSCGATVIPTRFFHGLGHLFTTAVRR